MLDPRRTRVGSTGNVLNAAYVVSLPVTGVAFDRILDNMGPFLKPAEENVRLMGGKDEAKEALSRLLRTKELDFCGMEGPPKAGCIGDGDDDLGRSGLLRKE